MSFKSFRLVCRVVAVGGSAALLSTAFQSTGIADSGSLTGAITAIEMKTDDAAAVIVNGGPGGTDSRWFLRQGVMSSSVWWSVRVSADPRASRCTPRIALDGQSAVQDVSLVPQQVNFGLPTYLWNFDGGGLTRLDTPSFDAFVSQVREGVAAIDFDCGALGRASWSLPVSVIPAPPVNRSSGISINDGEDFTNSANVQVFFGWEDLGEPLGMIDRVRVSNDGGFAPSKSKEFVLDSSARVPWTLVKLGNERLPRHVYVKFHQAGGSWLKQTYSDDIVLDTVKPTIQSATMSGSGSASVARSSRSILRVRAKDNRSGVEAIQTGVGGKRSRVVPFKKRISVPAGTSRVRVQDGAGNWSKWRAAN